MRSTTYTKPRLFSNAADYFSIFTVLCIMDDILHLAPPKIPCVSYFNGPRGKLKLRTRSRQLEAYFTCIECHLAMILLSCFHAFIRYKKICCATELRREFRLDLVIFQSLPPSLALSHNLWTLFCCKISRNSYNFRF